METRLLIEGIPSQVTKCGGESHISPDDFTWEAEAIVASWSEATNPRKKYRQPLTIFVEIDIRLI